VFVSPYFDWETVIGLGAAMPDIWMGEIYYNGLYNYPESEEFEQRLTQKYGKKYALGREGSAAMGFVAIETYAAALKVTGGSDKPQDIMKALQDLKYDSIFGPTWIRAKENGIYSGYAFCHVVPDKSTEFGYRVVESLDLRGKDFLLPVEDLLSWRNEREEWFKSHAH
jgi:ABC-type branched-subunit amino acid transport system substrate-binding protein